MPESRPGRNADRRLDARGWLCPQPVIEARRLLRELPPGGTLEVLLSDPHGPLDFQVFCQRSGVQLLEIEQQAEQEPVTWRIRLRNG